MWFSFEQADIIEQILDQDVMSYFRTDEQLR